MIIIDIPTWQLMIGWFFSQVLKFSVSAVLIVHCLNKFDGWLERKMK